MNQFQIPHPLNKSRMSAAGLSASSLNGSREQVSIMSLNSYTRTTPKFVLPLAAITSTNKQQPGPAM